MPKTAARKSPPTTRQRRTVKPHEKVIPDPVRALVDRGLWGLFNLKVLHCFGLIVEAKENKTTGLMEISRLIDHRDNPVQVLTPAELDELDRKWNAFLKTEGTALMAKRKKAIGFVAQPLRVK